MKARPAISIGQHSEAGPKERNDDSYGVVVPGAALLEAKGIAMAIADGMSSSEAAKIASETCVKSFLEDYYATHPSWTVKTSVGRVLLAVNRWLHAQGVASHLSDRGMVTTFSGLVLKSATAHIFHAGDSRIYLLRNGAIEQLTRDHRVRISREREYLSRAVGVDTDLEIDYRAVPIEPGDVLIFTTDGVHDFLRDDKIAEAVRASTKGLDEAARRVVQAALTNGGADNLTCQIVRVDNPGKLDEAGHIEKLSALPFPPELTAGQVFEGYRILRELHLSKRTQVYLAKDEASGDTVVLKTPSINYVDDLIYIEMFTREEWIGRLVASPHVLQLRRPRRPPRSLYYVTEYCEGQTLRQWMRDNPRPDPTTVRLIVDQIAKGLRAFHRKEVIHRDLKPENIMIDRHGTAKIIDFGSAYVAGLEEAEGPADKPGLVGTLDYIAPEYHLGEAPTDRSDIYSLAVIAYEMLTGKLPYGRGFSGRRDIGRLKYVSASDFNDAVPAWFDAALAKATHWKPSERTEALSALMMDLQRPNPNYSVRPRPLLERNPAAFWRGLALVLAVINLLLICRPWW